MPFIYSFSEQEFHRIRFFFVTINLCSLLKIFCAPLLAGLEQSTGLKDILLTLISSFFCDRVHAAQNQLPPNYLCPYHFYSSPLTLSFLPSHSPPLPPHSDGLMEIIQSWEEMKSPGFTGSLSNHISSSQRRHGSYWGTHFFTLLKGCLLLRQCERCFSFCLLQESFMTATLPSPLSRSCCALCSCILALICKFISKLPFDFGMSGEYSSSIHLTWHSIVPLNGTRSEECINHLGQIKMPQGYMTFYHEVHSRFSPALIFVLYIALKASLRSRPFPFVFNTFPVMWGHKIKMPTVFWCFTLWSWQHFPSVFPFEWMKMPGLLTGCWFYGVVILCIYLNGLISPKHSNYLYRYEICSCVFASLYSQHYRILKIWLLCSVLSLFNHR